MEIMNNNELKLNLINENWKYIKPNNEQKYKIINFDDVNFQYSNYTNSWIIFDDWQGKYSLVNYMNPEVIIKSISS